MLWTDRCNRKFTTNESRKLLSCVQLTLVLSWCLVIGVMVRGSQTIYSWSLLLLLSSRLILNIDLLSWLRIVRQHDHHTLSIGHHHIETLAWGDAWRHSDCRQCNRDSGRWLR